MNNRVAIIRIRGECKLRKEISDTFKMLRLYKKHNCIIIPTTPAYLGMLTKVKDYVTWGDIDAETLKQLLLKRGKLPAKKKLTEDYVKEKTGMDVDAYVGEFMGFKKELKDIPGLKLFFKLSPPVKGFERKGVKKPFSLGGVLGYRKEKINDLIKRML
ncbi:MAG: 50S ribosomal protein L30 [Candidatus Woesearchaeota archaeon]